MPLAAFRSYAALVESLLPTDAPLIAEGESLSAIQVERGTVLGLVLKRPDASLSHHTDRLLDLTRSHGLNQIAVVDRLGHHRPLYRPLLLYAALQTFRLVYETLPRAEFGRWEEGLRAWADLLEAELTGIGWDETSTWAGKGASAAELAWTALALHIAGKVFIRDAWTDLASDLFGKLAAAQRPNGAFLLATPSDNPETLWYHKLAILHASAAYAAQAEDKLVASAVQRNTQFHQAETQPDHATSQPLGLFAFIWNPPTRPLADQLLHNIRTQHPGGIDGISLILLADALLCLRLFLN